MKTETLNEGSGNLYLAGSMVLAFIDPSGLIDYALKTSIAGFVWLGFNILKSRMEKKRSAKTRKP